jgi:hypothetical protein
MDWCSVKAQGQLYLYLSYYFNLRACNTAVSLCTSGRPLFTGATNSANCEIIIIILLSRHKNAGHNHNNINTANRRFKSVTKFKYLGMTVTNQSYFYREIKNRLNSVNDARYHSKQNIPSPAYQKRKIKKNMLPRDIFM